MTMNVMVTGNSPVELIINWHNSIKRASSHSSRSNSSRTWRSTSCKASEFAIVFAIAWLLVMISVAKALNFGGSRAMASSINEMMCSEILESETKRTMIEFEGDSSESTGLYLGSSGDVSWTFCLAQGIEKYLEMIVRTNKRDEIWVNPD